jgi:hypothetical protein
MQDIRENAGRSLKCRTFAKMQGIRENAGHSRILSGHTKSATTRTGPACARFVRAVRGFVMSFIVRFVIILIPQ